MLRRYLLLSAAAFLLQPGLARAQNQPLSTILPNLLERITLAPPTSSNPLFVNHEAHFTLLAPNGSLALGRDSASPVVFNSIIVAQLSTFPIGSSSGGFTWQFDPTAGTFTRSSESFGPSFAERGITTGRNKWTMGMNYVHAHYDRFGGQDLQNGNVTMFLQHEHNPAESTVPFYEGDVIREVVSLDLTSDTAVFNANYGVTNRLDVGVAVPVIRLSMNATSVATIERLATAAQPALHQFPGGGSQRTFSSGGTATGVGDILLRGKYNFYQRTGLAMAGAVDVRVPTGDEKNLLGAGITQTRVYYIVSRQAGRYAPHVNIGYTFTSGTSNRLVYVRQIPDEMNYTVGLDTVVNRRLTIVGDFMGRSLRSLGQLTQSNVTFNYQPLNGTPQSANFSAFTLQDGNLGVRLLTFGAKYNPFGNLLISGSLIVPASQSGLYARVTPVIGIDYAF